MDAKTEEIHNLRQSNDELRKNLKHMERYSRDFNIRVLGVSEEDGEDCMTKILNYITRLILASKMWRLKLRTHIVQGKSMIKGQDILLPNFIVDLLK